MTVATDTDPYFALPKLYGAPAYARPPRVVPETERPFDPDELPIAAEPTDEERVFTSTLQASGSYRPGDQLAVLPRLGVTGADGNGGRAGGNGTGGGNASGGGVAARRFSLRTLTERLGPSQK